MEERLTALTETMAGSLSNCFVLLERLTEVESMVRVLQLVSVLVEVRLCCAGLLLALCCSSGNQDGRHDPCTAVGVSAHQDTVVLCWVAARAVLG